MSIVHRLTRGIRVAAVAGMLVPVRPLVSQNLRPVSAAAAESTLDARTRAVASQLRCPVCQGLSLQDSPSELSQQMRTVVREQLAAGRTPDQVKAYFVARYGEWILMTPAPHGFNWLVYLLPFLMLGGGAWVLVAALRRWTHAPRPSSPSSDSGIGSTGTVL